MTSHLDDPARVRAQYASEWNLQARQALWREVEGPNAREIAFDRIAAGRPRRVLEVGGGDGWLSAQIRDELGADVVLVDQSERMVELSHERGLNAIVGDVQELPFEDESFDTAVAAWMLYHVPDLDRGLGELARVLEPRGRLVAVTTSLNHIAEVREMIAYPQEAREHTFNSENGEEALGRHFEHVERTDVVTRALVRDRQTLVDYAASIPLETKPIPDDLPLPFHVYARLGIFVATK
ncbi:MAG TPA: class I SAM-dependent methyltransferase [Gaiellaceae bacterium]|nr:class I SAM-dependent methyltransferase [Gaiellaceae bacterium]